MGRRKLLTAAAGVGLAAALTGCAPWALGLGGGPLTLTALVSINHVVHAAYTQSVAGTGTVTISGVGSNAVQSSWVTYVDCQATLSTCSAPKTVAFTKNLQLTGTDPCADVFQVTRGNSQLANGHWAPWNVSSANPGVVVVLTGCF